MSSRSGTEGPSTHSFFGIKTPAAMVHSLLSSLGPVKFVDTVIILGHSAEKFFHIIERTQAAKRLWQQLSQNWECFMIREC